MFVRRLFISLVQKIQELWCFIIVASHCDALHKKFVVWQLRRKPQINVVFIASFLSQWKYQPLYNLFKNNPKFYPVILVAPMRHHEQSPDYFGLKQKLKNDSIDYIDFESLSEKDKDIRKSLKPDILFYIQPYYHIYDKRIDSHSFKDKLICYTFYGFQIYKLDWAYNLEFMERAWKVFYAFESNKRMAEKYTYNKGRNVEIVGYLNADMYASAKKRVLSGNCVSVWKQQCSPKKKVVWTPHLSITADSALRQSNFLHMADDMLYVADKYADQIQFSFKPHPSLYAALCMCSDWGKEKTDAYYATWANGENTQLDNGEFVDLFIQSDAMINDSGSFTAEYIYTLKPAINCFINYDDTKNNMTDLGRGALLCQYRGNTLSEIESFLQDVVLGEKDPLLELRKEFYDKYLSPSNAKSVTENIYNSIIKDMTR